MNSIIQYLLIQNQYLLQIISFLFKFICKYIPLRQWIFDDSNSSEYQKFKVDEPPLIKKPVEVWHYKDFLTYIKWKYDIVIKPVKRHSDCHIPDNYICPHCNAPILLLPRKTASFLEYINALTLNAHTILTILKRLIKSILPSLMVKIITSFIISTVNLL